MRVTQYSQETLTVAQLISESLCEISTYFSADVPPRVGGVDLWFACFFPLGLQHFFVLKVVL